MPHAGSTHNYLWHETSTTRHLCRAVNFQSDVYVRWMVLAPCDLASASRRWGEARTFGLFSPSSPSVVVRYPESIHIAGSSRAVIDHSPRSINPTYGLKKLTNTNTSLQSPVAQHSLKSCQQEDSSKCPRPSQAPILARLRPHRPLLRAQMMRIHSRSPRLKCAISQWRLAYPWRRS